MRLLVIACISLILFPTADVFGETGQADVGVVIGRAEVRLEEKGGRFSMLLEGIEVDIVRDKKVGGKVLEDRVKARTSDKGVFMAPLKDLEGRFRIARLRLPESREWIDISKLSIKGDVILYGAEYFRRFGSVVALNPMIYEESYDGSYRFIMVVAPFADICLYFLGAFPDSPWRGAVEEARSMSMRAEGYVEGVGEAETEGEEEEPLRRRESAVKKPGKPLLSKEVLPESGSGVLTVIIVLIVLITLAVLVCVGGRRGRPIREREIDIRDIELIEAEKEKQPEAEEEGGDPTVVLSQEEGWFLREFRRARVRIHWKKYDSAVVSLEKTTRFMEEHIDRLREKKEVYALVLHYSYLGRCYLEAGRYNDALGAFKRGIELNEYNSRTCEIGLADTLDAIVGAESSPTIETLSGKYPLLSGMEIEKIIAMGGVADA